MCQDQKMKNYLQGASELKEGLLFSSNSWVSYTFLTVSSLQEIVKKHTVVVVCKSFKTCKE